MLNIKFLVEQGISFLLDTALFEVAALLQLHILCTESKSQFSQAMSKETFSAHFFDESKTSCKRAAISKLAVSSKKLLPGRPII